MCAAKTFTFNRPALANRYGDRLEDESMASWSRIRKQA